MDDSAYGIITADMLGQAAAIVRLKGPVVA